MVVGGAMAESSFGRGARSTLAIALALGGTLCFALAAESDGKPLFKTDMRQQVRVRWVHYPVLFQPKIEDGCDGLGPEMVEVSEDGGPPLPVADLSLTRLPTIHAVVIDISSSRTEYLPAAVAAASQYATKIRPQDEMAVLTLGENLRMVEGFAPAREVAARLAAWGEKIRTSGLTALWDGLDDLLRYLAPRPERKVVILLSDGCDTASLLPRSSLDDPSQLAAI
ncbi:MAG: hypothetical protein Q9Q40_14570 [Acidobacteriota bacterium]|nr:hypothetical protein [Acidobacteriota bacterium]